MKYKFPTFLTVSLAAALSGCVSVEDSVAPTPSRYWKAPADAVPQKEIAPESIKTDKIEDADAPKSAPAAANGAKAEKKNLPLTSAEKLMVGSELELGEVVDIALENNTTTRVYWFQAKSYAAALGKANSAYYPQVSVGAQVYRAKNRPNLSYLNIPIGAYYETGYGPSLELNWMIYDFGKREANIESAREAMRAANFDYNQALQEVVLNVNESYYGLYAAVGGVKAAQMNLEDAKTAYDAANTRFTEGVGTKQEMLTALANMKNSEFSLEAAKTKVETARAELANSMGVRVSEYLKISDMVKIPSSPETAKKVDELIAKAMRSRQDLLASYAQLRKTKSETVVAERDFLPQINAVGSGSYLGYTQSGSQDQYAIQGGLTLTWNIFEGFAKTYNLISAKALERAQAQKLKSEEIRIISDVWSSYHAYKSYLKQVVSADAAMKATYEAYEATKIGYENGVNTITDLLNTQANLATARQQKVSADSNLAVSIAKLSYSTGALIANTEEEPNLPVIKQ